MWFLIERLRLRIDSARSYFYNCIHGDLWEKIDLLVTVWWPMHIQPLFKISPNQPAGIDWKLSDLPPIVPAYGQYELTLIHLKKDNLTESTMIKAVP